MLLWAFNLKLFIFIFLLTTNLLYSMSINDSLLKIHATLVPKISLMDYSFKKKALNNSITIAVYYNNIHYKNAKSLKHQMEVKYKKGIQNYNINIKLISYNDINKIDFKATIYYLFPATKKQIKKCLRNAAKNKTLTFSYLESDLKHGVMLSVKIGVNVKPIINLEAIKSNGITLRPILLDISIIYIKLGTRMSPLKYVINLDKHKNNNVEAY